MHNVIGDIHGDYDTLRALLRKMPDAEPIAVGDMIDRGLKSKQVLDFFMAHGRSVLGNHCHMFYSAYLGLGYYDPGLYPWNNGGIQTLNSFGVPRLQDIPSKYAAWMHALPHFIREPGVLITHAAKHPSYSIKRLAATSKWYYSPMLSTKEYLQAEQSLLWNPGEPRQIKNRFQIHGHMRHEHPVHYGDWGINLDTMPHRMSGIHWPSLKVYTQEIVT